MHNQTHALQEAAGELLKLGYTVFAGVRKTADADRLAAAYPGIFALNLDVTKPESIKAAVEKVKTVLKKKNLPLVALVNNAGVQKDLPGTPQRPVQRHSLCYPCHLVAQFATPITTL